MNVLVSLDLSSHVHSEKNNRAKNNISFFKNISFSFALLDIHFGNDIATIALLVKNYENRHLYFQHDSEWECICYFTTKWNFFQ